MQNNKKTGGLGLGIGLGLGLGGSIGSIGSGGSIGLGIGGVNRHRVRAGDEHRIPFEKHPPPPRKKKLTS